MAAKLLEVGDASDGKITASGEKLTKDLAAPKQTSLGEQVSCSEKIAILSLPAWKHNTGRVETNRLVLLISSCPQYR